MLRLNFHTYISFGNKHDEKQRKYTMVELFNDDVLLHTTTVILNPKDRDNKPIAQKFAVKKLLGNLRMNLMGK